MTYEIFKESFQLFGLILQAESHPLSHLGGCADDPSAHDGSDILDEHPPVHFSNQGLSVSQNNQSLTGYIRPLSKRCQVLKHHLCSINKCYLIRRRVHPSELFEVLFNVSFDGLNGLGVV